MFELKNVEIIPKNKTKSQKKNVETQKKKKNT
jgi:hypothetical protein